MTDGEDTPYLYQIPAASMLLLRYAAAATCFRTSDALITEARLLKTDSVTRINKIICQRGLKQVEEAKLLGLSQPDASRLLRGSFREYSVERLLRLLTVLDLSRPEAT